MSGICNVTESYSVRNLYFHGILNRKYYFRSQFTYFLVCILIPFLVVYFLAKYDIKCCIWRRYVSYQNTYMDHISFFPTCCYKCWISILLRTLNKINNFAFRKNMFIFMAVHLEGWSKGLQSNHKQRKLLNYLVSQTICFNQKKYIVLFHIFGDLGNFN